MKEVTENTQKTVKLSDGRIATIGEFKGKHISRAQSMAGENSDKLMLAIVSICVTIEGSKITLEDLEEMSGFDVLLLLGEFSENFSLGQNK